MQLTREHGRSAVEYSHVRFGMLVSDARENAIPVRPAKMRRRPPQEFDERLLGFAPSVEGAEQRRALDFEFDGIAGLIVALGRPREQGLDLGYARFLREPRGPFGLACASACGDITRGSRFS